ncbi:dermonecrotic toxin domain-containing protein [Pseudomonas sp.]|uniref:dermonecrotic toxin domain-containing protein n=1 Tax=Pseudomonas sp. TaxID=306 RepID=UPI003D0DF068
MMSHLPAQIANERSISYHLYANRLPHPARSPIIARHLMPLNAQQSSDLQSLRQLATQVSTHCPDIRQMARSIAKQLLARHNLSSHDPDQVYFHRFHSASSSPRTFSGWQHYSPPYQSLTLPQLVMHRFSVDDQNYSDELANYTGFYSAGPGKDGYDESNEIPLAPKEALEFFWEVDFSADFHQHLEQFWSEDSDAYRTLAKSTFLSKVLEVSAQKGSSALAKRARQVAEALTGERTWPPTLQQLQQEISPAQGFRLCTFDIGGHIASSIFRVVMEDGYQLLYLPGEVDALQLFSDARALNTWVLAQTGTAEDRARFMSHFALNSQAENDTSVGLGHLLDVLKTQWDCAHPVGLNTLDRTLQVDAFSYLRDATRQRMLDDAHFALRSNADLRKQLWIGYLAAFAKVFGPMAAVDWPVALAVVGAGLAETGLNIDQAINGHTTAERQAGVTGAILAGVNTLFNVALLYASGVNAAGEIAEATEIGEATTGGENPFEPSEESQPTGEELEPATSVEIEAWVPKPFQPSELAPLLESLESNDILRNVPDSGRFTGILFQDGKQYAMVGEDTYQVRYVRELKTWVIIDPDNPYSFARNVPIVADGDGNWQFTERLGLRGGTPRFLLKAWGRLAPRPAIPALEPSPYEVPQAEREPLQSAADGKEDRALSDPYNGSPYSLYRQLRDQLATDAQQFYAAVVPPARPVIPEISSTASPKEILRSLYEQSAGLVIGESHTQKSAKQFLISTMRQLKKQGVDVLYMEHFMTDFHQADLDLFNRTGTLPDGLKAYVENYDYIATLGEQTPYTMKKVLHEAYKQNVRIQAIDCLASYRQAWYEKPSPTIRQEMMNFFAQRIIEADKVRRGAGRWVALVGNSHVNTFNRVPGLSELQGAIGLRIEDIEIGQAGSIGADSGFWDEVDGEHFFVRNDLLLQVAISRPWM